VGVARTAAERRPRVRLDSETMNEDEMVDPEEREIGIWTLRVAFRRAGKCHVDTVSRSSLSDLAMRRSLRTAAGGPAPRKHVANPASPRPFVSVCAAIVRHWYPCAFSPEASSTLTARFQSRWRSRRLRIPIAVITMSASSGELTMSASAFSARSKTSDMSACDSLA